MCFAIAFYDKLQHMSFAYHDREHTGDLMSKATADVEAIRRYVNMGMVRSLEAALRAVALLAILVFINWELTLISLAFIPFIVTRSVLVMGKLRAMWTRVQITMGETVTVLQENLVGINVVKAFASEEFEKRKYDRKALQLRSEYFESERTQGTNSAWMSFYFTVALGLILWYGGWEVLRGDLICWRDGDVHALLEPAHIPCTYGWLYYQQLFAGYIVWAAACSTFWTRLRRYLRARRAYRDDTRGGDGTVRRSDLWLRPRGIQR